MSSRSIMAHEATIKTAVVEVKALTISGRQVTLSVYRQLKDEPILDEDTVQLRGVPWGIVNYFWGECAKGHEHLHVVWQKADQLRRACVFPNPEKTSGWKAKRDDIQPSINAVGHLALGIDPARVKVSGSDYYLFDWEVQSFGRWYGVDFRTGNAGSRQHNGDHVLQWLRSSKAFQDPNYCGREWDEKKIEESRTFLNEYGARLCGTWDLQAVIRDLDNGVLKLIDFETRWREQYAALAELDHLFIAV